MKDLYHCPECGREHDEPAEAAFVLTVRCVDCELESVLAIGSMVVTRPLAA